MFKKPGKIFITAVLAGGALALGGAIPAQAGSALLYDDKNYSKLLEVIEQGEVNVTTNDRVSSIRYGDCKTYYENADKWGRSVRLCGDYNDLAAVNAGLGWFETWNDRISAVSNDVR